MSQIKQDGTEVREVKLSVHFQPLRAHSAHTHHFHLPCFLFIWNESQREGIKKITKLNHVNVQLGRLVCVCVYVCVCVRLSVLDYTLNDDNNSRAQLIEIHGV